MKASRRSKILAGTVFFVAGAMATAPVHAGVAVTPEVPTEGQPTAVTVTDAEGNAVAGVSVQAVYRPGSEVEHIEDVGRTSDEGSVDWTPTGAGVVTLQTVPDTEEGAAVTRTLSVRFDGVPLSGLFILLGAGVVLYGGVIRGFRSLRSLPPALPPDT